MKIAAARAMVLVKFHEIVADFVQTDGRARLFRIEKLLQNNVLTVVLVGPPTLFEEQKKKTSQITENGKDSRRKDRV